MTDFEKTNVLNHVELFNNLQNLDISTDKFFTEKFKSFGINQKSFDINPQNPLLKLKSIKR